MMPILRFILLAMMLIIITHAKGEPAITFQVFGKQQGLTSNFITCLLEDSEGVLWVGTNNGLNKFYGNHIQRLYHDRKKPVSVAGNYIVKILEDSRGIIWIITRDKGITRYDRRKPEKNAYTHFRKHSGIANGLGCERIINMVEWDDNYMLVTAEWCAPMFLHRSTLKFTYIKPDLILSPQKSLSEKPPGRYHWMAGMVPLDNGKMLISLVDGSETAFVYNRLTGQIEETLGINAATAKLNVINQTVHTNHHTYMIGWQPGIFRLDKTSNCLEKLALYHGTEPFEGGEPHAMMPLHDTLLLVAYFNGGLIEVNLCTHQVRFLSKEYFTQPSFRTTSVMDIICDNKGGYWIGTAKGLLYMRPGVFETPFYIFQETIGGAAHCVFRHPAEQSVMLLNKYRLHTLGVQGITETKNLKIETPYTGPLEFDNTYLNGSPVILTENQALVISNDSLVPLKNTFKNGNGNPKFDYIKRLTASAIKITGTDTTLFLGSHGNNLFDFNYSNRVLRLNEIRDENFDKIGENLISGMITHNDTLFVSTRNGLFLYHLKSQTLEHYTEDPADFSSLPDNGIYGMVLSDNKLWLATRSGVAVKENGKFTSIQGIHEYIRRLRKGRDGRIYALTIDQVFSIDPVTFDIMLMPLPDSRDEQQLVNIELDYHDNLYVIYSDGYAILTPERRSAYKADVKAKFSGLMIGDEQSDQLLHTNTLKLRYFENHLNFRFGSDNAGHNTQIRYRYKLEGLYDTWQNTGAERPSVNFPNLPAGKYSMVLQAGLPGMEFGPEAVFNFIITPPFWETWWFLILMLLLLLTAAYYLITYNLKQKIKILEVRNQIARDLHDDIGSTVSSIKIFSGLLQKIPENYSADQKQQLTGQIHNNASAIEEKLSDIIWTIRPGIKNLEDLIRQLERINHDVWQHLNIRYHIEQQLPHLHMKLNDPARKHILLIYREVVNNAAKHSGCTSFKTRIFANSSHLIIETTENGKAYNSNESYNGNGLKNIRERLELLNGFSRAERSDQDENLLKFHFPFTNIRH